MRIAQLYFSDIRQGADKLHELLDGRITIPDKLGVVIVGVMSALLPIGILMLCYKGEIF